MKKIILLFLIVLTLSCNDTPTSKKVSTDTTEYYYENIDGTYSASMLQGLKKFYNDKNQIIVYGTFKNGNYSQDFKKENSFDSTSSRNKRHSMTVR